MGKLFLLKPKRFGDARGWFMETYSEKAFATLGIHHGFVQDNHSFSAEIGTLRGLHFQTPPFAQAKLVRCTRGAMFDVAVDVRRGSPTYGQWIGCELSAQNGHQLYYSGRLCPWLRDADSRLRGAIQGFRALCASQRWRHPVERSGYCRDVAACRRCQAHLERQG